MTSARAVGLALLAASFGLSVALYHRLPAAVPMQFDLAGHAQGFVAKPLGPFVLPLLGLGAYAITAVVLARQRASGVSIIPAALSALFFCLHAVLLRAALDSTLEGARLAVSCISLFVAVLGNYLGKVRRNRWVGIRTPWTLADDEVWQRTHRLGAWLSVVGGLLAFLVAVSGAPVAVVVGVLAGAWLVPVVYSYVISRHAAAHRQLGNG